MQSIKNDLGSRNPVHVSLALQVKQMKWFNKLINVIISQCIANIGSKDMAEAFGQEIPKLLVSG